MKILLLTTMDYRCAPSRCFVTLVTHLKYLADLFDMINNNDTSFAITEMSQRSVDNSLSDRYSKLMKDYEASMKKTSNIRLLASMLDMLNNFDEQFKSASNNMAKSAESFADSFGYVVEGDKYVKTAEPFYIFT